jgi:hypothetical protein
MSLNVTKRNATTQPIAGTSYVNEVLDAVNGKPNGTSGNGDSDFGRNPSTPLKIVAALSPDGMYSVKTGQWKDVLPESSGTTLDDMFEFVDDADAVAFVAAEILAADGVHNLQADDIVFGVVQPQVTDQRNTVFLIPTSRGIIDLRYNTGTHAIQVTFDGSTWIDKVFFTACAGPTQAEFFGF